MKAQTHEQWGAIFKHPVYINYKFKKKKRGLYSFYV
jgi:hypothetical protein